MLLGVVRETGLEDRVTGDLTEITARRERVAISCWEKAELDLPGEFPDLGSNAVLFHQRFFSEMEL